MTEIRRILRTSFGVFLVFLGIILVAILLTMLRGGCGKESQNLKSKHHTSSEATEWLKPEVSPPAPTTVPEASKAATTDETEIRKLNEKLAQESEERRTRIRVDINKLAGIGNTSPKPKAEKKTEIESVEELEAQVKELEQQIEDKEISLALSKNAAKDKNNPFLDALLANNTKRDRVIRQLKEELAKTNKKLKKVSATE